MRLVNRLYKVIDKTLKVLNESFISQWIVINKLVICWSKESLENILYFDKYYHLAFFGTFFYHLALFFSIWLSSFVVWDFFCPHLALLQKKFQNWITGIFRNILASFLKDWFFSELSLRLFCFLLSPLWINLVQSWKESGQRCFYLKLHLIK